MPFHFEYRYLEMIPSPLVRTKPCRSCSAMEAVLDTRISAMSSSQLALAKFKSAVAIPLRRNLSSTASETYISEEIPAHQHISRPPEKGLLGRCYQGLGFRATERILRARRFLLRLASFS